MALMTLHSVGDYGTALQALATQGLIERAGARCSVVDFRREGAGDGAASYFSGSRYAHIPLATRAHAVLRGRDARRRSSVFRDFLKRRLHLTPERYCSFDDGWN